MSLVILIVLVLGVGAGYLMPADVSGFLDYLLCGHLARRTVLWELQQPHRQYGFQTFWNICKKIGYKVV